ncbi:hypothetical protein CK203_075792 [Vitis vinifera]|uniref:Uncharacterized protein n=1 Tax=Vitis vinifera TaxID=29760 RepID=A0A438F706_VITVI|nr:hypothetical protein CK203_075792 [Vitis vinifera]
MGSLGSVKMMLLTGAGEAGRWLCSYPPPVIHGGYRNCCGLFESRGIMLRKRSRASTSKQALMADCGSLPSPTDKYRRPPSSSFFSSPRLFTGFSSKVFSETETMMSPTSILDSKPFSGFRNPFTNTTSTIKPSEPEPRRHWDKLDSRMIGLGIVDALTHDESDPKLSKPESRMVLFGSQLKIQIPPLHPQSSLRPNLQNLQPISASKLGILNSVPSPLACLNLRPRNQDLGLPIPASKHPTLPGFSLAASPPPKWSFLKITLVLYPMDPIQNYPYF